VPLDALPKTESIKGTRGALTHTSNCRSCPIRVVIRGLASQIFDLLLSFSCSCLLSRSDLITQAMASRLYIVNRNVELFPYIAVPSPCLLHWTHANTGQLAREAPKIGSNEKQQPTFISASSVGVNDGGMLSEDNGFLVSLSFG